MNINKRELIKKNYQPVLFVFLAFLAMVLVSYTYTSNIVNSKMLLIGEEIMNTAETTVTSNLSESELFFSNAIETVESMLTTNKSNKEITAFLESLQSSYGGDDSLLPDFMKSYAYIRGEFLDGSGWTPPEGYVPQERPWYIGAIDNGGKIFFSDPYLDADTGGTCISFSKEVFDDDGVSYGILALDLDLSRITDYLDNQRLANNGYGILLSDKLIFASHPDETLLDVELSQAGAGYNALFNEISSAGSVSAVRFVDNNGTDSIAFMRSIFNGWYIGIITPRSSYFQQVYQLGTVISIMGFVLMAILSIILVRTRYEKMRSDEENKSKSAFLSRVSHEMRTPLNAITGMVSIARGASELDKIKSCLETISDASDHLLGVINDVLDMSAIESGKLELCETGFQTSELVRQAVNVMKYRIENKKQKFTVTIAEDVPEYIISDRQHIAQVVTNLLSNANKFTPENGNIALHVSFYRENNKHLMKFDISDDGIGIAENKLPLLFRPFEQVDGGLSRRFGGIGLGLSISKNIVERMGGKIFVVSKLGKGSTFSFYVPVKPGSMAPVADENAADGEEFKGKRILLAEDVEINREILIALLDGTGVEIDCAENGKEAVEKYIESGGIYDLIFMDIHMPVVDGYDATERIRLLNMPRAKTVPIIAMTANVFQEDIDKCLAAGMDDHIGKPLDIDTIINKMKRYLS